LRDGSPCNTETNPSCFNFTPLNAEIVIFNISYWSNYSIGEDVFPPVIDYVQPIPATNPTEAGIKNITFNFTATDLSGVSDLNSSTAKAYFQKTGETTRSNTSCVQVSTSGNSANYSCMVGMWYFDDAGAWTVNVTISDNEENSAENSSTSFTYNPLTAMVISPGSLTWPELNLKDTYKNSTNNPLTINNTGNSEDLSVNITSYDLQGETTTSEYIYANNFTIYQQSFCYSGGPAGTSASNATSINISTAILQRGNNSLNFQNSTSGQETLFFCLVGVPDTITSQSYSSSAFGPWEIIVSMVLLIPRRRTKTNKKYKQLESDSLTNAIELILENFKKKMNLQNLQLLEELSHTIKGSTSYTESASIKAINLILEELSEKYMLGKEEILESLIYKLARKYNISNSTISHLIYFEELEIPLSIFTNDGLGGLEAITKYLKENLKMKYSEIAKELKRDQRTIWSSYNKATKKRKEKFEIKDDSKLIPMGIFSDDKLTVLENVIIYLKNQGMKYSAIGEILNRDQRNVWTTYSRAIKKFN